MHTFFYTARLRQGPLFNLSNFGDFVQEGLYPCCKIRRGDCVHVVKTPVGTLSTLQRTWGRGIMSTYIPNFLCVLTNERYKTYQMGFSFCRLGWNRGCLGVKNSILYVCLSVMLSPKPLD